MNFVFFAIAAAVLLVVSGLVRGIFFGYPEAVVAQSVLSRKEQAIVAACADALFPAGGPIPISGSDAGLVRYMDGYLRRMQRSAQILIRLLFVFTEHGPWIFGPRRARFTMLPLEERVLALDDMRTSRIYFRRLAFLSMRTMLTMGYLANADVARKMGMIAAPDPFQGAFA